MAVKVFVVASGVDTDQRRYIIWIRMINKRQQECKFTDFSLMSYYFHFNTSENDFLIYQVRHGLMMKFQIPRQTISCYFFFLIETDFHPCN